MSNTLRPKEDQNVWNFILSVLFVVVLIYALRAMWLEYGAFPQGVDVFDALLMAFAAFRITRLVVYDKITRWFRELFMHKVEFERDGVMWVEVRGHIRGLRATLHDLLSCPWCIGFWSALVVAFCYFMFPWAWFVIFFLALAGVGSFIQLAANAVGWKAENLKLDSQEKEQAKSVVIDLTSLGK